MWLSLRSLLATSGVLACLTLKQAQFTAQGKLLAEAEKRVFELETSIKENAHKVDRLKDYERRIEQLTLLQKLW